jgi:antitoxin component YwqK of YwqJK toxin-antitoxin module
MKKIFVSFFIVINLFAFGQNRYDAYNSDISQSKGLMRITKDGELLTGIVFGSFEDGTLQYEESYKNGKKDGVDKFWYSNGQLRWESYYVNGKIDGVERRWYKNGQMWSEINFKNGEAEGIKKEWSKNGKLTKELLFKSGKKVKQ